MAASTQAPRPTPGSTVASVAEMQRFIETKDMSLLDKPMLFAKHPDYTDYICFQYQYAGCLGCCLLQCMSPVASFCPGEVTKHASLELHRDHIVAKYAINDCCFHVAQNQKTILLDRVLEVGLTEDCSHSCCNLKTVAIQTAAQGGAAPEVAADYLSQPEKVQEVLRLAVQLHQQQQRQGQQQQQGQAQQQQQQQGQVTAPAQQGGMAREGGPPAGDGVMDRLQVLDGLVARGALAPDEAARLRMPVLAAPGPHPLARLADAAASREGGALSPAEYEALKGALIGQLLAAAGPVGQP